MGTQQRSIIELEKTKYIIFTRKRNFNFNDKPLLCTHCTKDLFSCVKWSHTSIWLFPVIMMLASSAYRINGNERDLFPSAGIFSPTPAKKKKKYMIDYFITLYGIIMVSLSAKFSRAVTNTLIWWRHGACMPHLVIPRYTYCSVRSS